MTEEAEGAGRVGWFHCGKCGALFGAEVGAGVPEQCPECGRDPVVSHSEMAFVQAGAGAGKTTGTVRPEGSESRGNPSRGRSEGKRKDGKGGLGIFVMIWVLVLIVLAGAVSYFRGGDDDGSVGPGINLGNEDSKLLSENFYELRDLVKQYFAEGIPERRTKFVLNSGETLRRMVGFEQANQFVITDEEPEKIIAGVIRTPLGKSVETVWKIGKTRKVEVLFVEDGDGGWKMDWANMVRYSERNWPLFLAGEGADEAEFRVLARRRSEDGTGQGGVSSVVLVGPRMGYPGEIGAASPEIVVDPASRVGRVLSAAFDKLDAGEGIYGSRAYTLDPRGMIRVRVRLTRMGNEEKSFAIREVVACHWYDFDDLGLEN